MNKTKLFLVSVLLVLSSTMPIMAQVFCTPSSSAGTLSGYTTSFQMTPIVASGSAWYWTTTLTAGLTYSFSNCTSHGGISENTYLRIYNSSDAVVATNDNFGIFCTGSNASLSYTPTVTDIYYIHLSQSNCATLTNNQQISFMETNCAGSPTITASGPTTFCSGGSVILTSSSATNNVWSTGATTQSITVFFSGSRTVRVNECTSAPTIVTVNPQPGTFTASSNSPINCSGNTLNLTATTSTNAISYAWTGPNGFTAATQNASIPNVTPAATGTYTVVATHSNGCTRSTTTSVSVFSATLNAQTFSVGAGGDYTTLTSAVAAYNTSCLLGPVIFELTDATYPSETFPITVNANSSASAINTLTIRPSTGSTGALLTSGNATATIDLNGSKYITIDGRPGGSGSKVLSIENTGASSVIRFINNAQNNIIQYSTLQKSGGTQVVLFSTAGSFGNINNTIDNCDLRNGASSYITGINNSITLNGNNTISNNNIFNFTSSGVLISAGTNWIISGNSFYQTTATTVSTATIISIRNSNHFVSGNYLGGSAPQCGGSAWTITGTANPDITGILINNSVTNGNYTVSGNIISNFSISSSLTTGFNRAFTGINVGLNIAVVGNGIINNNVIGSSATYGAITINTANKTTVRGITSGVGNVSVTGNTVGSIVVNCSHTSSPAFLYGIAIPDVGSSSITNSTFTTVSGNTIGSETVANSLFLNTSQTSLPYPVEYGRFYGIIVQVIDGVNRIDSNIVSNMNGIFMGSDIIGIRTIHGTIRNNRVHHYNKGIGISSGGGNSINISGNEVYAGVSGIRMQPGGTGQISNNLIHHITGTGLSLWGGGAILVSNNMISLGYDANGDLVSGYIYLTGINHNFGSGVQYVHNSIYIGGTGVLNNTANSYAFKNNASFPPMLKDNILVNQRTNSSGTGKHYVMQIADTVNFVSDYNLFQAADTSAFAFIYPSDRTFANYKTATGQDANSIVSDPNFINPDGNINNVNLHINTNTVSPASGAGTFVATVIDDFDGDIRNNPPDIGADEFNACTAATVTCPVVAPVANDAGQCGAIVNYPAATVTGTPAPTVTYSHASGSFFPVGTTTVTVNASNICSNVSCTFDVVVNDNTAPVVQCAADLSFCEGEPVLIGTAAASDNCGNVSITNDAPALYGPGTYLVTWTATDAYGNSSTCTQNVTVHVLNALVSVEDVLCYGENTGSLTVIYFAIPAANPLDILYSLDGGTTTQASNVFNNLPAGNYNITIINTASNCITTVSSTINQPTAPLSVAVSSTNSCPGSNTGTLSATPAGGTIGYTIEWFDVTNTKINNENAVGAGTYTVIVIDANGCTVTNTVNVGLQNAPSVSLGNDKVVFYGALGYNGCHNLTANATGNGPFIYNWSSADPNATISTNSGNILNVCVTVDTMYTYTVLVTDANGCISTASVNVIYTNIDCSNQQNSTKVKICMVNSGNPANCQTVCLSINAAQNLLNNGSYIGPCLPNCAIPQARTNSSAPNMNNDVELNIYPNPAHQSVHIAYISKRENKYEINLIDVLGRTIQVIKGTSVVGENDIEINLQQLSKGIYQLVFIQNEIQEVKKLVVE